MVEVITVNGFGYEHDVVILVNDKHDDVTDTEEQTFDERMEAELMINNPCEMFN